jgi:uncharacterized membrane protein YcjF (UPF0283 family)
VEIILLLIIFSVAVGYWADAWGRNGWAWGIVAVLISPLLTAIALLIVGKTIEKKAQEIKLMNEIINK